MIEVLSKISSILYFIIKIYIKHEHAHVIVVKNGGCNTSHTERVEQAFYTKYTGK